MFVRRAIHRAHPFGRTKQAHTSSSNTEVTAKALNLMHALFPHFTKSGSGKIVPRNFSRIYIFR